MIWAQLLAYVTGTVDQELLLRNEYLAAENRILKAQIKRRCYFTRRKSHLGGDRSPAASKITALALGSVEDLVVRSDSRCFGVGESFSRCAFALIAW